MATQVHPVDDKGRSILGAHTSASGGAWKALVEGTQIDANGVQFFTANQRQWVVKEFAEKDVQKFEETVASTGLRVNMSHGSYLVNLGGANEEQLKKSRATFKQELERCHQLGIHFLVFHPGSAADSTVPKCLRTIADSLIEIKDLVKKGPTQVLIESTAGQGAQTGHDFAHLATLMEFISPHMPIGICLDTCHMFAAGYDLRTEEAFDKSFMEFDRVVGLKYLKAFHVNDSLSPFKSRVDRHAMLGEGHIGWLAFKLLMTDPRTALVPKYLETPGDLEIWKREIAQLRAFANGATELPTNTPSPKFKPESSSTKPKSKAKAKKNGGDDDDDGEQKTASPAPKAKRGAKKSASSADADGKDGSPAPKAKTSAKKATAAVRKGKRRADDDLDDSEASESFSDISDEGDHKPTKKAAAKKASPGRPAKKAAKLHSDDEEDDGLGLCDHNHD